MGLQDQLNQVWDGVTDLFQAPIGLVYDTARAISSSEYNPGFTGVFGEGVEGAITGLSSIGEGLGFGAVGRFVGEGPAGGAVRTLFDEFELAYSTEFQQQQGQAPFLARQLGAQPGDVSLQRVGATLTGQAGAQIGALHGGDIREANLFHQWERAAIRTPGQAWIEQSAVPDFYSRTPQEQEDIRETAWYQLFSGSIDAVGRWFTDPGVIAGKGFKFARNRYWTFRPDVDNNRFLRNEGQYDDVRSLGYEVGEELEPVNGMRMMQLKEGEFDTALHVTRSSALAQIEDEGLLRVPPGADEVLDADITVTAFADKAKELVRGEGDIDPRVVQTEAAEVGNLVIAGLDEPDARRVAEMFDQTPEDALTIFYITEGVMMDIGEIGSRDALINYAFLGRQDPDVDPAVFARFDERGEQVVNAMAEGNSEALSDIHNMMREAGASDSFLNASLDAAVQGQTITGLGRINSEFAGRGLLGSKTQTVGQPPRFPGTTMRPMYLLAEGDLDEAYRYAAALYQADPTDMPVIIRLNADGLPVVFEDFDLPTLPDPRSGNPSDASIFTLADKIEPEKINEIIRIEPGELDPAMNLAKTQPGYLEPSGRFHSRLFEPNGSPIEPDQIIPFEEFRDDFITASHLYSTEGAVASDKFLTARQRQRNTPPPVEGQGMPEMAANHRVVQQHLNWMDGRSADEIRRVLFPNNPLGGYLSVMLSDAKTYRDRRTILLASMGYKLPEFDTLEPIIRAKISKVLEEADRVRSGRPPDETFVAMMGLQSKFKDVPPEAMNEVFEELLAEMQDQGAVARFLEQVSDTAPVRELRMPITRRATNMVRRTRFYQESPMARPLRSVSEWKPHQFVNVRDGMSDIQLVRQLEEAAPLGISADEVGRFRREYLSASNDQAKIMVLERAERRILDKAAEKAGLTPKEFEDLINASRRGKQQVGQMLESRRYAPGGRDKIRWYDDTTGELTEMTLPLLSTQTQAWVPLANVREIIKHSTNIGRVKARIGSVPVELLDSFYQVWKPSVLLRGGWMVRVVSDEQLRILASSGSILKHLAAIEAGEQPTFSGIFKKDISLGQRVGEGFALATGTRPITALSTRISSVLAKGAEKIGLMDSTYLRHLREVDLEPQVSARASFGGPSESTLHDLQALMGRDEFTILDHLYSKSTGQWRSITSDDRMFGAAWSRVLKEQFGRDPLGRHITGTILAKGRFGLEALDDADYDDIVRSMKKFLTETAEGREVAERMPWRSRDPEKWADDLIETLSDYTAGFDEGLLRGIMDQKVTPELLESIDEALRPDIIHAEIVEQAMGNSVAMTFVRDFISESFDLMGRLPTDTLSRQPFFKQMYAGEMSRLGRLRAQQGLDFNEDAIARMNKASRQYAMTETRTLLYDLAEVSRFGHMVRHIAPFYPAWQEVIKVWAKLATEDPSLIARARILWQAPNKADMVYTDDEGEEYIQFRMSEKTADNLGITGWQRYVATGGLRVGKSSFNLVLNSPLPGAGPLIQYPINEVVKKKPELEESLRWLLPFGVSTDSSQIFLSPLVRQLRSEIQGATGDRSYQRAFTDALTWMDVEYRSGRRTVPPTEEEAHDIARKLFTFRLGTRLASPAQPIFDSPLQPYIDIYRDMQDNLGPEKADEVFLNEYGQEFFAVTLSRTVSETGIPPTVEAEVARRSFEELIESYPEYGRLILGDDALGEFSTAAFAAQLERPVDPDNPFSAVERAYRPAEIDPRTGGIIEVDRRLGWQEYIQAMDIIDLERKRLGLASLRVTGAETLAQAKKAVTQFLAQKYPSWWEDFNTRDDLKWDTRITAFRDISKAPGVNSRPDIQGLTDYLTLREAILQELNRRKMSGGASTLEAVANEDLANVWEAAVFQVLEDNIAFGPLYFRYLEGDPVRLKR